MQGFIILLCILLRKTTVPVLVLVAARNWDWIGKGLIHMPGVEDVKRTGI